MSRLRCGIVGLPNVGKSTLFNALTRNQAEASNYPFCTIDPNVGVVEVPDGRLAELAKISKSQKILYALTEFVDIAGLVEGASKGEGLGNKFLANIRETDAICHIVRCFDEDDVVHVAGGVDPIRDIEVINLELELADLQMCENAMPKVAKLARTDKDSKLVLAAFEKVKAHLDGGKPARTCPLTPDEWELLKPYPFLTQKKVLYVCNVSEDDLPGMDNEHVQKVRDYAAAEGNRVVALSAKIEEELAQFEGDEQQEMLETMGLVEPGLNRLVKESFQLLGLITFLTTGEVETRAWTIHAGETAPQAAGEIHSDIQRGFIRAEVVKFDDMVSFGGRARAREGGRARAEGKDYIVQDGDVILFHHA